MSEHGQLVERRAAHLALVRAAQVCRAAQGRQADIAAATKDDRSPVTVADFASQAVVVATLLEELGQAFADVPFVGEEDTKLLDGPSGGALLAEVTALVAQQFPALGESDVLRLIDHRGASGSPTDYWTLDPVDGTKGFLRREQYAVALGRVAGGRPEFGALACPALGPDLGDASEPAVSEEGTVYVAHAGGQLFCGSLAARGPRSAVSRDDLPPLVASVSRPRPPRATAPKEKAHGDAAWTDRAASAAGLGDAPVRLDSSAKYAIVARGDASAYLRLPSGRAYVERVWDHAAGALVATVAGCIVSDIDGRPLDFGAPPGLPRNSGVVVADARVHAALLEAIARTASEPSGP